MAQMEFYFNDNEIQALFKYIRSKGGKFIPDLLYKSQEYNTLNTYEELKEMQQSHTAHFFLIDNIYSIQPLMMSQNRYLEKDNYYVNQRKGGPYIDFMFYRGHSEDAIIPFRRSEISIYPKFIHIDNYEEFKATDELKGYYEDIVNYIKMKSKQIFKNKKKYWIGKEVLSELPNL